MDKIEDADKYLENFFGDEFWSDNFFKNHKKELLEIMTLDRCKLLEQSLRVLKNIYDHSTEHFKATVQEHFMKTSILHAFSGFTPTTNIDKSTINIKDELIDLLNQYGEGNFILLEKSTKANKFYCLININAIIYTLSSPVVREYLELNEIKIPNLDKESVLAWMNEIDIWNFGEGNTDDKRRRDILTGILSGFPIEAVKSFVDDLAPTDESIIGLIKKSEMEDYGINFKLYHSYDKRFRNVTLLIGDKISEIIFGK